MSNQPSYTVCLPDWEDVLPKLCILIGTLYSPGEFEKYEKWFINKGMEKASWDLTGRSGMQLSITLEKYEGYFFGTLKGSGANFQIASELLWKTYLTQGGNPDTQKKPFVNSTSIISRLK